ncbi:MAG TPA: DUF4149 domain-containing protein [Nitrospiraceae bacterium]|nr:DUF4149 domain-containing protein [Nitrospiraceae bacterium]
MTGAILQYGQLLATSILVGKVLLLSFVVAPILASTLEREPFSDVVRRLFPAYYLLGIAAVGLGLLFTLGMGLSEGWTTAGLATVGLWLAVGAAEFYCRSALTPHSNAMRDTMKEQEARGVVDQALRQSWERLHRQSVWLNSLVLLAGLLLLGLSSRRS